MCEDFQDFFSLYINAKPEIQEVIYWVIKNIDYVDEITNYKTTEEKLEKNLEWANQNKDMYAKALLVYKQLKDKKGKEKI